MAIFSGSAPHQPLPIIITLVNKIKVKTQLLLHTARNQNQNQNTVLLLWYADTTAKKTQRRQQIGRDPSSYLTERFFSTFQIHKQVFLSFLLYYYTTKIIEIQIHSQISFFFFLRESTATERDASPNELKVNFLIQNPHQNELEDAKSFRKQEKDVERNFNQHTSIFTHASTSIRIHYQLQLCYFLYLAIEKV